MNYKNKIDFSFWYLPKGKVFNKNFLIFYKKILPLKQTKKEVDFIEKILKLEPGVKILDLACGWGRHSIELANRGCNVTGQDTASFFLKAGREEAEKAGVEITWVESDMRKIPFRNKFDVVLNLFTSFGYFEKEDDHQKVFSEVAKSLKPGGYFFLDVINRERILHPFKNRRIIKARDGSLLIVNADFELLSGRMNEYRKLILKNGLQKEFYLSIRIFTLTELITMAKKANLVFKKVYGDFKGAHFNFKSKRCILITQKNLKNAR